MDQGPQGAINFNSKMHNSVKPRTSPGESTMLPRSPIRLDGRLDRASAPDYSAFPAPQLIHNIGTQIVGIQMWACIQSKYWFVSW